jgi:hypothetical protein
MQIHTKPISCADCGELYDGDDDEVGGGHMTGSSEVYVGRKTGWVYFGEPIEHEDDKHLCPGCATERYPILIESINAASQCTNNTARACFHPPSIATRLAIDFAIAVSAATIADRQQIGPEFGVRRYSEDPNDSTKLILSFADKSVQHSVEVLVSDIERMKWQRAAGLLRSAIAQYPKRSRPAS